MKKKFTQKIKTIAVAAMATVLLGSCKNDAGTELNQKTEDPELSMDRSFGQPIHVSNDWLQFSDIRSFEETMSHLEKLASDEALDRWASEHKGFESWRSNEEEEIFDEPKEAILDIPDPLLTTVLSKTGRIQIADTIYQIHTQGEKPLLYAIPEKYAAEISGGVDPTRLTAAKAHTLGLLLLPFPRWQDNDRVITPIPISNICDFPTNYLFPWWGQKGGSIYSANNGAELIKDNGRNVRIDYHRWGVGFIFYSSVGVRVKIMKHTRLGGWMSTVKMDHANIQACTNGMVLIPGLIPSFYNAQASASANNTNNLERTLKWVAAPLHVEIIPEHFNFDFYINYRGQQISRSIRE